MVGGVKGGLYIGSCRDVEGIVRFPQWHSLSLPLSLSLGCFLSRSDSSADCQGVIYAVIRAVLADISPYFIMTLIIEMRHLGVKLFSHQEDKVAVVLTSDLSLSAFGVNSVFKLTSLLSVPVLTYTCFFYIYENAY